MMDRRTFIGAAAGGLLIRALVVRAQQQGTVARVGYLRRTSREPGITGITALRQGLRELGYVEPQNLVIYERYANGDAALLPDLARELIQLNVQVLVVDGAGTVRAVRQIVGATPLVFTVVGDPIGAGFVRSLDYPGDTMTGITSFGGELLPKRLQLLREVAPGKRAAVLTNPTAPEPPVVRERLTGAARSLGVDLMWVDAQSPSELAVAFAKMRQASVEAVLVGADAMFFSQRARIVELAARHKLPAVYAEREFADAGGLMAYAPNLRANFHRAAAYVDKILKGAKAGDLPVEQPTKFDLVVNLKTAKALGIKIPQSLLARADEVIQ